ncbi:lipoprotein heptaprenylglyceryl N-acetyltransferase LhaT [Calidifontibacillus erzurumensis]|uniref:DUF1405 domain-containing protein n=1 Tax=Calidifontibacillus erzurumensis TaxID=2741433 RepID=A0A8J8GEP2_9BACI|nr:DUF1405 domain-containing protein [Calidifontibacillus erzurumensis]NSL52277.1 DUF1405 domain-containing protein [Calidifontibacillus erzurumensis]
MKLLIQLLGQRSVLWCLLLINIAGTIYGYYWYGWQIRETPAHFLLFVPDSPTASLFFVFVLIAFLMGKNWPLFEVLAIVTLFKYGIWAVVMNVLVLVVSGELPWQGYMLIASHFAMAVEGLLYAPYYRFRFWHLMVAAIWTLHNDVIDYVFGMMPRYSILNEFMPQIGYFTFWLSILSIFIAYILCVKDKPYKSSLF